MKREPLAGVIMLAATDISVYTRNVRGIGETFRICPEMNSSFDIVTSLTSSRAKI